AKKVTYYIDVDTATGVVNVNRLDDALKGVETTAPKATTSMEAFSSKSLIVADIASSAIKAIAGKLVEMGQEVVQTGAEFEQKMARVAAVSKATSEEYDQLKHAARDMGSQTRYSASEAADALS